MRSIILIMLALAFFALDKKKVQQTDRVSMFFKDPLFSGTIFIDPDIIKNTDQSTFKKINATGTGNRTMFDRRVNNWITVNAHLFKAEFADNLTFEVQVNPEISLTNAQVYAEKYARAIGRLPKALRSQVQTVWIHKGNQPFGGGNNNLLIHLEQADDYEKSGILEEALVHEASHTSLDGLHASKMEWKNAQKNDKTFISTYARDNSDREDIAESFLPYLAVKYLKDRISSGLADTITQTIPNRIKYFASLNLEMMPIEK